MILLQFKTDAGKAAACAGIKVCFLDCLDLIALFDVAFEVEVVVKGCVVLVRRIGNFAIHKINIAF
jgi:hypothetical protein